MIEYLLCVRHCLFITSFHFFFLRIFMSLSQADNICKEQDLRSSHHFILKVTSHLFYKSLQFLGHALYAWRIIQHGNVGGGRLLPALDTTSVTMLAW